MLSKARAACLFRDARPRVFFQFFDTKNCQLFFKNLAKLVQCTLGTKIQIFPKNFWLRKHQNLLEKELIVTSYENHFSHFHGLQLCIWKGCTRKK
jgi:hypothetical protein